MTILEKNFRLIELQYNIGTAVKVNVRKADDKRTVGIVLQNYG
jgi:hypothetical protein